MGSKLNCDRELLNCSDSLCVGLLLLYFLVLLLNYIIKISKASLFKLVKKYIIKFAKN